MSQPGGFSQPDPNRRQPPAEVFRAWQTGDRVAGDTIARAYLDTAHYYAQRYNEHLQEFGNGVVDADDIAQAALISIVEQAKTFDPDTGNRFLSYAAGGIAVAAFHESVVHQTSTGSQPRGAYREILRRYKNSSPSANQQELAEQLGINAEGPAVVDNDHATWSVPGFLLTHLVASAASLDKIMESDPDAIDSAVLVDAEESRYRLGYERKQRAIKAYVRRLMDLAFDPGVPTTSTDPNRMNRLRQAATLLFGLEGEEEHTVKATGEAMGVRPGAATVMRHDALKQLIEHAIALEEQQPGLRRRLYPTTRQQNA